MNTHVTCLIVAVLFAALPVQAAVTFTNNGQNLLSIHHNRARDVVLGDFDQDGDLDALVAQGHGSLYNILWLNDGMGQFTECTNAIGSRDSQAVAAGDLDGDGDLDVWFANYPSGPTNNADDEVWFNQGGFQGGTPGEFSLGCTITNSSSASVAFGDLDGDGDLDAAVWGSLSGVWWNDGTGRFPTYTELTGSGNGHLVLADLDGDGNLDILLGGGNPFNSPNPVFLNDGPGTQTFTSGPTLNISGGTVGAAVAALDGDTNLDVFMTSSSGTRVWWNNGTNGFSEAQVLDSETAGDIALADLDSDGDNDAFVTHLVAPNLANGVWINNGDRTFTHDTNRLGNAVSWAVALGDLDGDGDVDAFVANDDAAHEVWLNTTVPPGPFHLTDPDRSLLYVFNPLQVFSNITLTTRAPMDWNGTTLTVEIVENFTTNDYLYFDELAGVTYQPGTNSENILVYQGVLVAHLSSGHFNSSVAQSLSKLTFGPGATSEAIQAVLRSLTLRWWGEGGSDTGYGFRDFLTENPTHVEPAKRISLRLVDAMGNESRVTKAVDYTHLIGIRLSHHVLIVDSSGDYGLMVAGIFQGGLISDVSASWELTSGIYLRLKPGPLNPLISVSFIPPEGASAGVGARVGSFSDSALVILESPVARCVVDLIYLAAYGVPDTSGGVEAACDSPPVSLPPFYALEQLMNQTPDGRRLADLYWQHTAEVLQIVKTNTDLIPEMIDVMTDFQPGVAELLSGTGEGFQITQPMIDRLNAVLDEVVPLASPELSQALQNERAAFNGFQDFVGKDFNQWAQMLGVTVPSEPLIFVSRPRREDGKFTVEANAIAGQTLSLWRSVGLLPGEWEPVLDAEAIEDTYSVTFTDPTPPAGQAFYRVRTAEQ